MNMLQTPVFMVSVITWLTNTAVTVQLDTLDKDVKVNLFVHFSQKGIDDTLKQQKTQFNS